MYLLYLENCSWEIDFIRYDILNKINDIKTFMFQKDNVSNLMHNTEYINNNILVLNGCCELSDVINVVKIIKPISIFFLSDESGDSLTKTNWIILEQYTHLFFRQYNHNFIKYSKNNFQIPLGYVSKYMNGVCSLSITPKKINNRDINASFIGTAKSDRLIMKTVFESSMEKTSIKFVNNNWDINNMPFSQKEMFDLYSNSIFVINGRGNSTLDCFRIYEAASVGAIPVIVGSKNEINITFNYENSIPPFIFADTWDNAVQICNKLLKDMSELQNIQHKVMEWWHNLINTISLKIENVIIKVYIMHKYINKIETAFANAENYISKINKDIIDMHGMTGTKTRHFYNNLLNSEDVRYLEIGTWKGSSVCSAMFENTATVVCIDNFSEDWGHPTFRDEFLKNFEKYKGSNNATFIEGNCFQIDKSLIPKINIYMYDGNHSAENHYKALEYYYNVLDETFIYIVDDWNWVNVRTGTKNAIRDLKLNILYEKEVLIPWNDELSPKNWHNGMYVCVLKKNIQ